MEQSPQSNGSRLPGWVAAIAFAATVGSFLLVFFTVHVGEAEPVALKGIDLVLGVEQPATPAAALEQGEAASSEATTEDPAPPTETSTEPPANENAAERTRRLLKEQQQKRAETPAPAVRRPSAEKTRAPMAIALVACAVLGLIASLIPQRAFRFVAAACGICGLICAALLMTGAKDLPLAQLTGGAFVVTGAFTVTPGIGLWGAIGGMALATLLAAIGLTSVSKAPEQPRDSASHTKAKAVAATPAMRTYSSSEKRDAGARASAPTRSDRPATRPSEPEAAKSAPPVAPSPPPSTEKTIPVMVPEEPPKGPDSPPPPSTGDWSFKQPGPAQPTPAQGPGQPPQPPPSSWSFGEPDRSPQQPPQQTPANAPGQAQQAPPQPTAPPQPPTPQRPTWSFGEEQRPPTQAPPPQAPVEPPPQPHAGSAWSFGSSDPPPQQPPRPAQPPPPPPAPPPPTAHFNPPPPPPHNQGPMENQGPSYPPPPNRGGNAFLEFARPYFDLIDSGALYRKPFVILYIIYAGLNLLGILGVLGFMFKGGVALIITGLFTIFALWVGFQLWWNRREKVNSFVTPGSEFVALPVFSHLFQTIGEWIGTMVAIAGTGAALGGLIGSIFSERGGYGNPMAEFTQLGVAGLIACPLAGFLILIFSRAIAEQIRALARVADNTRNIDHNTRR